MSREDIWFLLFTFLERYRTVSGDSWQTMTGYIAWSREVVWESFLGQKSFKA